MRSFFLLATLFASALATDSNSCSTSTSANTNEVTTVAVTVGINGTLRYSPDDIQVAPGNIVQFEFMPKNHTVTESSFANPCVPLAANLTSTTRPGVKSGFVPTDGSGDTVPAFRILINDTKPIWLYCGQTPHCQKGMVMVINQNRSDTTNKTLDQFRAKAMAVPIPSSAASGSSSSSSAAYGGGMSYTTAMTSAATSAVTPAAQTTSASGPALSASSTVTASSSLVSVFNGGAAPTGQPMRLAALGGLAVAAAAML